MRLRPEIDEPGEYVDEIRLRIDAVQFAGLDQRREAGPVLSSAVMTGEQCILSIQRDRTHAALYNICVELDAAIVEEARETVPMLEAVANGFGDDGLAGDAGELFFEIMFERGHERRALLRTHGAALICAGTA